LERKSCGPRDLFPCEISIRTTRVLIEVAFGFALHGITLKLFAYNHLKVEVSRMRLASILLSAILLSCLSIQAHAGDGEDYVIAVPSINAPNMDMPEPIISAPNMSMPAPKPKPIVVPKNNTNLALNQTGNMSSNQTQVTAIQQEVKPMDVSGKWSIKFNDGTDRSLDLNLWSSSGTRIMGYGTLTKEGEKNSVTASGSVIAQELTLIAKSATPEYANQKYDEYDLDLFMVNNTLSGTYILKSGGQFLGNGNATAVKQ
jgi:hypothetical protein